MSCENYKNLIVKALSHINDENILRRIYLILVAALRE
jgi:hypothetical protein